MTLVADHKSAEVHLTSMVSNPFTTATMLRQIALIRDFGDAVATATHLLSCDSCGWTGICQTYAEGVDARIDHEASWRPDPQKES